VQHPFRQAFEPLDGVNWRWQGTRLVCGSRSLTVVVIASSLQRTTADEAIDVALLNMSAR